MRKIFPSWAWKPYRWLRRHVTRPELRYVETHLTDHCNLNCRGCGHFSPIASEWFADLDCYQKDLRQLRRLFSEVRMIRLMGGEPLLHPRVIDFIDVTRAILPRSDIRLVTNGLLLFKMGDEFWEACRKNQITIDLTVYPPLEKRLNECIELCKQKSVPLVPSKTDTFQAHMNLKGDSDIRKVYRHCYSQSGCFFLHDGRIYQCAVIPMARYFNERFGCQIECSGGVDLYTPRLTGWTVLEFLHKPAQTCRFCTQDLQYYPWTVSSRTADEWDVTTYTKNKQNKG